MENLTYQSAIDKSPMGATRPQAPGASQEHGRFKQITEQLELALDHIYQLSLTVICKARRGIKKAVPMIPYMVQLCIDYGRKEPQKNWWKRVMKWIKRILRLPGT